MERLDPEDEPKDTAEVLLYSAFYGERDLINIYRSIDNPLIRYKLFLMKKLSLEEVGLPGCYYDTKGIPRVNHEIAADYGVVFFESPGDE